MQRGMLVKRARSDARNMVIATAVLALLCAGVLGANWKYVYNWVAGPFQFDASLSATPGSREFVRVEGLMLGSTGVVDQARLRPLRGVAKTKPSVTADYLAMLVDGRVLVVKVEPGFSGKQVEGRLVSVPDVARGAIGPDIPVYPWLVDGSVAYRWDFNLLVMIAAPLFPLMFVLLLYSLWRAGRVERHPALAGLKPFGRPRRVAAGIEDEMMLAGEKGHAGPVWVTASWVVVLADSLRIYPIADLIGVGFARTVKKSGNQTSERNSVRFWARGRLISDDVDVSEPDVRPIIGLVAARLPWAIVEDTTVFEQKWRQDRNLCETQADARRGPAAV